MDSTILSDEIKSHRLGFVSKHCGASLGHDKRPNLPFPPALGVTHTVKYKRQFRKRWPILDFFFLYKM